MKNKNNCVASIIPHPSISSNSSSSAKPLLIDIRDMLDNPKTSKFLVYDFIEENTTGGLIGSSGSGKSFLALDLAASVATGTDFCNSPTKGGQVIYLAGEGRSGITKRLKAWEQEHGTSIPRDKFLISSTTITLDKEGAKTLINIIKQMNLDNVELLVIDTLARHIDGEENSNTDMGEFIAAVDEVKDELGCVAVIIHHTGHGQNTQQRARGASSFYAALDFELLVEKKSGVYSVKGTKDKESDVWPRHEFNLESTDINNMSDDMGKPINSAVVTWKEEVNTSGLNDITSAQKRALSKFKEALKDTDENSNSINLETWREYFYTTSSSDNPDSLRASFNKLKNTLLDAELITLDDESNTFTLSTETETETETKAKP